MPKTRTKTVDYNSHKENCEDFLISDWILRKVEENVSTQTCDHFKDEGYRLLNLLKTPLQIHYRHVTLRDMKVSNLSKSPSLALFSSENCVGAFF